ncbi:hypothetical protein RTZ71_14100 [Rhodococcus qingshengii]|uniref:O-methyltransferase n=1 Tax=Rhodococcus qingshengii TaxID=334542 RepID=UPI0028F2B112|nr:O-methyltransferase [Rhodococcus qingshengii]MDT9661834.1 hypothetical protein [Rhodococcus qingshengii]
MVAISYENRPSKAVSRAVFFEALRKLSYIAPLSEYGYVGFGALEFIDFEMAHRNLGIDRMTSIEADESHIDRYVSNSPFGTIEVVPGRSSAVLSGLNWNCLSIVWLDYQSTMTTEVVNDIETLARVLVPGSVLAVTLNCHPVRLGERRNALENAVTADRVPIGTSETTLGGSGLAAVQWEIFNSSVRKSISNRMDGARWLQILNMSYQDAAKMQFFAGIIGSQELDQSIRSARFSAMREYRSGKDPLNVRVPLLTANERRILNRMLPIVDGDPLPGLDGLRQKDIRSYVEVYRWLETAL